MGDGRYYAPLNPKKPKSKWQKEMERIFEEALKLERMRKGEI